MTEEIDDVIDWRVIPAPPGYLFWWIDPKNGELFAPTPITGWAYYRRRSYDKKGFFWAQHPITAEDASPSYDNYDYAIQFPDGRVHFPENRTVDTLEEAKKYAKGTYNREAKTA